MVKEIILMNNPYTISTYGIKTVFHPNKLYMDGQLLI